MVARELPAALRYLKGIAPYRYAVFGCTSASAVNGREGMLAIQQQMERELGCPSITVLGAVLREIENRKARSVAVLTPYIQEVNIFFRKTMETFGVEMCSIAGMGLPSDNDIAALKPSTILDYARSPLGRTCASFPAPMCAPPRSESSWRNAWEGQSSPAISVSSVTSNHYDIAKR